MNTWNIGNTTVRNPGRLNEALGLFSRKMSGRPFRRQEQFEFQGQLIDARLVDSERRGGDDGARKFASAFKQLGFVTDWSYGKPWHLTPVGTNFLAHPEIENSIFLRQLLKYQIQSPLEKRGTEGFALRPFRLLLNFLKRAYDEGLTGLTKFEIGLYVITLLVESTGEFESAFHQIKRFRTEYDSRAGKVVKNRYAFEKINEAARGLGLEPDTLLDYADSNSRYAFMSGLLTLKGNKLAISESRLPLINAILDDGTRLVPEDEYLNYFYDPLSPRLPTDDQDFLSAETATLLSNLRDIAKTIGEEIEIPTPSAEISLIELQAYEQRLRNELARVREIKFYREQRTEEALNEIEDLLEDIRDNNLVGGLVYAPAFFEWAIWRLFLALDEFIEAVHVTRGFKVDEDIRPIHHAKGGAADLNFTYPDFKLLCEMTLATGSRQFTMEGEPVTRHVFKAIEQSDKPVYGLFIARKLDPNTADAFYNARYWKNWEDSISTPIVALEIDHILSLVRKMRRQSTSISDLRNLLDTILKLQGECDNGPAWVKKYIKHFNVWASLAAEDATP
jgi:hypothetical protein